MVPNFLFYQGYDSHILVGNDNFQYFSDKR